MFIEADDRNRTYDLMITNQLLYQLSYIGKTRRLCVSQQNENYKQSWTKCKFERIFRQMFSMIFQKGFFALNNYTC